MTFTRAIARPARSGPRIGRWMAGAALALSALAPACAQQALKVGYIKTYAMLPLYQAMEHGYFKARGLDVELVTLNNGPAVASAVQSGSLDVGYAALSPMVAARSRGQDFRFFAATSYESSAAPVTMYVASARSGVKSFKDVAGKTVAINTASGGCDLGAQDHTEASGVAWSSVKSITIPFPQMQAALELGNADVVCTVDPFFSAIMASKKIGARVVATSPVAQGADKPLMIDGFFSTDGWLKAHGAQAAAFTAALEQASRDLAANKALVPQLLEKELRFTPEIAASVKFVPVTDMAVSPASLQPMIDAMKRRHFITTDVKADSLVYALPAAAR